MAPRRVCQLSVNRKPGSGPCCMAKKTMSARQPNSASSFSARSKQASSRTPRSEPNGTQNAKRNYERYVALARAEALAGNLVGAENYFQHAEHYFRSMSADRE
jgi:hypothetical protein